MKHKIRYQSRVDLKSLRKICGFSKEYVADKIGYTVRTLERMEKENAVTTEETARQLCKLYVMEYQDYFYKIDGNFDALLNKKMAEIGTVPRNVTMNSEYYLLYVRRIGFVQDCILGKVGWVGMYNRNRERRRLRPVNNVKAVLKLKPDTQIINNKDEWTYWYYNLTIGKLNRVVVSEECMQECLKGCLEEIIVLPCELMRYEGITDLAFVGIKQKYRKKK